MRSKLSFNKETVSKAKGEYQRLHAYALTLKKMNEGRIITRSEVFELQMAVTADALNEICQACRNQDIELQLKHCLWRGFSFEDFMAVVYTHGWRRSA